MNRQIQHKFFYINGLLVVLGLGLFGALEAAGQIGGVSNQEEQTTRSLLTGQRVMQTFDFEERQFHDEVLPMYWAKNPPSEGFPHYSRGQLDTTHHRGGEFSFLLIPDGGSVGYEYDRRRIQVKAGSDFQVTGYVHIENAPSCRAQLSCRLTDRAGKIIEGSGHTSQLVGATDMGSDGWGQLDIYVPGNYPEARYLTVGIWFFQEENWNQDALISSPIFRRDVNGLAWFDDITIFQMPRVILKTSRESNVFESGESQVLKVEVQGVASLDYQARISIRDATGDLIHSEQWMLTGLEGEKSIKDIPLPQLTAGLYHGLLEIYSGNTHVADRQITFAQLAPLSGPAAISGLNFGVLSLDSQIERWDTLIDLMKHSNAKLIKLPVWRRQPELPGAIFTEQDFDQKLIQLQRNNIQVMATFSEVPDSLALKMQVGQRSLLDILSLDPEVWRSQVAFVLAQYAQQVPYWQIGGESRWMDQTWDPRIRSIIESMRIEFEKLVSNSVLAVPLSCLHQVDQAQLGTSHVALNIPSAVNPQQIQDYFDDLRSRQLDTIWATVEPLDENLYDRKHYLIDFAQRIAFTKKAGAQAIFIHQPWRFRMDNARSLIEPSELFLVYRTLSDYLGNAHFVAEFELAADVPALLFDRGGEGCLVTWNDNYNTEQEGGGEEIDLFLGQAPVMVDLFGNQHILSTNNGTTKFSVGQWPVIISGVNTAMAHLRATLNLEPATLDASIMRQQTRLTFTNPFNTSISGRLRLLLNQPKYENWLIDPPFINFALRPGETYSQDLMVKFPRNELAGAKKLETLITLDADRSYQMFHAIPFEIALSGVDVHIFARR
ncbi:MAG: hypothetical protein GY869_31180, partial [Planctomycetes bacterium]|nr:hypothetical protein [Planctomycetota bacterium]